MLKPDSYLSDPFGRFKFQTLYWYDGPQLWVRYEVAKKEYRLFVNIDDKIAWSGVIAKPDLDSMLENNRTLKDTWEGLTKYQTHDFGDAIFDTHEQGLPLAKGEAIGGEPLGDAYLEY